MVHYSKYFKTIITLLEQFGACHGVIELVLAVTIIANANDIKV